MTTALLVCKDLDYPCFPALQLQQVKVGGDPSKVLDLMEAIAMAMASLHKKNVLFRGLRPSKVLLDADQGVKITGFSHAMLAMKKERTDKHPLPQTIDLTRRTLPCGPAFCHH